MKDFDFGTDTPKVFDNMLERSVPFYSETQRMIGEIAADSAVPGTTSTISAVPPVRLHSNRCLDRPGGKVYRHGLLGDGDGTKEGSP